MTKQNKLFNLIKNIIIEDLSIDKLDKNEQDQIINQLGDIAYKRVFAKLINILSQEDIEQLENMLKTNNEIKKNSVTDFLKDKIPNYQEVISNEIKSTIDEFKQNVSN